MAVCTYTYEFKDDFISCVCALHAHRRHIGPDGVAMMLQLDIGDPVPAPLVYYAKRLAWAVLVRTANNRTSASNSPFCFGCPRHQLLGCIGVTHGQRLMQGTPCGPVAIGAAHRIYAVAMHTIYPRLRCGGCLDPDVELVGMSLHTYPFASLQSV